MNRSRDPANPGMFYPPSLVLYDPAFQNEEYLVRVLSHELSHAKFVSFSEDDRDSYAAAAGWKIKTRNKRKVYIAPSCCFVQPDGHDSVDEDFANNVEFLLFDEGALKHTNQGAWRWLRRKFGDGFKFRRGK